MNKILLAENQLGFCTNDHEIVSNALYLEGYSKLALYVDSLKSLLDETRSLYDLKCAECESLECTISDLRDSNDDLTDRITSYAEAIQKLDKELTRLSKSIQTTP